MFKMPYTNLHELNLNWILNKLKKLVHMSVTVENSAESSGDFDENSGVLALKFPFGAVGPQGPQGPQGPGVVVPCIVSYEPSLVGTSVRSIDLNHPDDEYYMLKEVYYGTLGGVALDIHVDVAGQPQLPVYSHTYQLGEVAYIIIEVIGNWVTIRDETTGAKMLQIHDPAGVLQVVKTVEHGWRYERVEMYPAGT